MVKRVDALTAAQSAQMDAWADRISYPLSTDCWLWTGAQNNGYGRVYVHGRLHYAHRAVYEALRGPVARELTLDHLCRTPICVNPDHLEPVSIRENCRRGIKGVLTTSCPAGHPYDESNTRRRPNGHRRCRACHNAQERARAARW